MRWWEVNQATKFVRSQNWPSLLLLGLKSCNTTFGLRPAREERSDKVGGYPQQGGGVRGKSATVESRLSHKKSATGGQGSEKGWDGDTLQGIVGTCAGGRRGSKKMVLKTRYSTDPAFYSSFLHLQKSKQARYGHGDIEVDVNSGG